MTKDKNITGAFSKPETSAVEPPAEAPTAQFMNPEAAVPLAKKDFTLKFTDGTIFAQKQGKPIKFIPPAGITREAVLQNLSAEGVI